MLQVDPASVRENARASLQRGPPERERLRREFVRKGQSAAQWRHVAKMLDPARRVFINEQVCEGCGDCTVQSNCVAVLPHETPLGRKRRIDQSACNKDYSCVKGFCPSFVGVLGGTPRRKSGALSDAGACIDGSRS